MGRRRRARILALQLLYQMDLTGDPLEESIELLWGDKDLDEEVRSFAEDLVRGVVAHRDRIDELIASGSEHWKLERMALVDRNILRLALYEILFRADIPVAVSINEAIEMAKHFSTEESGAFINGILDHIVHTLQPAPLKETQGGL
jgi:N utilization substance protein B